MDDLVSRLLEAIGETERRENSRFVSGWLSGDPCTLCGRPVDVVVSDSIGDHEMAVVRPCGHRLMGDDLVAFRKPEPAPDKAVLRRCAADRRRAERHAPSAPGIGPFGSRRFKDPEARICAHCSHDGEWGAVEWPCPDFLDLADSYGLEVTE